MQLCWSSQQMLRSIRQDSHLQLCRSLLQLVTGCLLEASGSHWLRHQHSGGQGSCHGLAQLLASLMRMAPGGAGC